jgi:hypothetical protein
LFVVALSVLFLSRLSLWRGFLPTNWRSSSSSSFRLDFSCLTFCWVQLCPRLAQHRFGFEHVAVISMGVSAFFVFAIDLLRGFLYPILEPLAFVPDTFTILYTHKFSIYGLFQNPGLPTCFSSFFWV